MLVGMVIVTAIFLAIPLYYGGLVQFWEENRFSGQWFGTAIVALPGMIYYGYRLASRLEGDRWAIRTRDDMLEFRRSEDHRLHVSSVEGFSTGRSCIYVDRRDGRRYEIHTTPFAEANQDILAALEAWRARARNGTQTMVAPIG